MGLIKCRFYSRLLAFEAIRILFRLGCDFRVYDSTGLPVKGIVQHLHPNVQESRDLSKWSDDPVWISPEQHGKLFDISSSTVTPLLCFALAYQVFAV